MKFSKLILLFFFISKIVVGQDLFQKEYSFLFGSEGRSICQGRDSSYFIAGIARSWHSNSDNAIAVLKVDKKGEIIWSYVYYTDDLNDFRVLIKNTSDNGLIIATSVSAPTYQASSLMKLDSIGNVQWRKLYKCQLNTSISAMTTSSDNGFIIAGYSFCGSLTIIKTDSTGNIRWQYGYRFAGNFFSDVINEIKETFDHGFIVTGNVEHSALHPKILLMKLNSLGLVSWSASFGDGSGYDVIQTHDSGFAIVGSFPDSNFQQNNLVIKTDSLGNILWENEYSLTSQNLVLYDIVEAHNKKYIIHGCTVSGQRVNNLIWADSLGNTLNSDSYNPGVYTSGGGQVIQDFDQNFIMVESYFQSNQLQMFAVKTDSNGYNKCRSDFLIESNQGNRVKAQETGYRTSFAGTVTSVITNRDTSGLSSSICLLDNTEHLTLNYQFNVYPNPAKNEICLNLSEIEMELERSYSIFNIFSEVVMTGRITTNNQSIDISGLQSGLYLIKCTSGKICSVRKFLKSN